MTYFISCAKIADQVAATGTEEKCRVTGKERTTAGTSHKRTNVDDRGKINRKIRNEVEEYIEKENGRWRREEERGEERTRVSCNISRTRGDGKEGLTQPGSQRK